MGLILHSSFQLWMGYEIWNSEGNYSTWHLTYSTWLHISEAFHSQLLRNSYFMQNEYSSIMMSYMKHCQITWTEKQKSLLSCQGKFPDSNLFHNCDYMSKMAFFTYSGYSGSKTWRRSSICFSLILQCISLISKNV